MKKIALEEACMAPGTDLIHEHRTHVEFDEQYEQLVEIGPKRIQDMDDNEIDISVLSLTTPGSQGISLTSEAYNLSKHWNDYLIGMCQQYPTRFRLMACLPTFAPGLAVREIERISKEKEVVGFMVNGFDSSGFTVAKYLDEQPYRSVWAALEKHDMPLYLHPRGVPMGRETTYANYPELHGSSWGFHVETGEHLLRLILSGLFDEYPKLKVIVGHMGEFLPFWAWRIDHRNHEEKREKHMKCKKKVVDYLRRNVYITTSGYFHTPALVHAVSTMGLDRVMFSVDYPYESTKKASDWFEVVPFTKKEREMMAYGNAAKLLKL